VAAQFIAPVNRGNRGQFRPEQVERGGAENADAHINGALPKSLQEGQWHGDEARDLAKAQLSRFAFFITSE